MFFPISKPVNYLERAIADETEFKAIVCHVLNGTQDFSNITVQQIFEKFSNKKNFWTIIDFEKVDENTFIFTHCSLRPTSGYYSVDKWHVLNDRVRKVENLFYALS